MSNNSFPPEFPRKTHKNDLHHYVPTDNRKNAYYNGQTHEEDQDDRFGGFVFTKKSDHKYSQEGKLNAHKPRQNPKQKYPKSNFPVTRSEPQPSERHISELEKLQQQLAQNGINFKIEDPLSQPPGLEKESDFNEVLMLMEQSSMNYEQQFNNEFNKKSKPKKKNPKQNTQLQQFVLPDQDFDPLASIPVQYAPIQSKQETIPQIPQIPQGVPFGIGDFTLTSNGPVFWGAGFAQQSDCPSGPQLNLGPEYSTLNGPLMSKEQPKERKKLNINAKPLNY